MIGIFLYLIILFIRPQDWPGTIFYGLPVTSTLIPLLLLVGMVAGKRRPGSGGLPHHLLLAVVVVLVVLTNLVNGDSEMASWQLTLIIPKIMVFYSFFFILGSYDKISKAMAFMALMGMVLSMQGIYQLSHGVGWANQGMHGHSIYASMDEMMSLLGYEAPRTFWIGDWDGPNVLALVYVVGVPYCLEKMFSKSTSVFSKIFWVAVFALLCVGIKQTDSRGGFLALAFSLMLFMLMRFGIKRGGMVGGLVLFLAVAVVAPGRISQVNTEESSARDRMWLWERGLNWWREKPVLGMGKGTFASHASMIAHSNYVEILAETGFVGFFTFISLIYFSMKGCFISMRKEAELRGSANFSVSRAALLTLAGFSATSFFVTMQLELLYVLYALCAACIALSPEAMANVRFRMKDILMIFLIAVSLITGIWLIAVKELL